MPILVFLLSHVFRLCVNRLDHVYDTADALAVVLDVKTVIWSLTDVPPERQKWLGLGKRLPSE